MNVFPYLAVFTVLVSFAVLRSSFEDLSAAPLAFGTVAAADEGLLDHELASADPINAWLDRYLTPPAN